MFSDFVVSLLCVDGLTVLTVEVASFGAALSEALGGG